MQPPNCTAYFMPIYVPFPQSPSSPHRIQIPVSMMSVKVKDHPRPCWEKTSPQPITAPGSGSPPPMRGKGFLSLCVLGIIRITPAHAGKSAVSPVLAVLREDHPRPCGEKISLLIGRLIIQGSPPPMRGKVVMRYQYFVRSRITPAHAGKSRHSAFAFSKV